MDSVRGEFGISMPFLGCHQDALISACWGVASSTKRKRSIGIHILLISFLLTTTQSSNRLRCVPTVSSTCSHTETLSL